MTNYSSALVKHIKEGKISDANSDLTKCLEQKVKSRFKKILNRKHN